MLSGGRNLDQLKAEHGKQAHASFQKFAARDDQVAQALAHEQLTDWTFGTLPEIMEIKRKGLSFVGYPALIDRQTHCDLDAFDDQAEARRQRHAGSLRPFRLAVSEPVKFIEKNTPDLTQRGMYSRTLGQ